MTTTAIVDKHSGHFDNMFGQMETDINLMVSKNLNLIKSCSSLHHLQDQNSSFDESRRSSNNGFELIENPTKLSFAKQ